MEVEYSLTAEDLEAFGRYHLKKGSQSEEKSRPWITWIAGGMVLLLVASWSSSNDTRHLRWAWFIMGFAMGGSSVVALVVWMRKAATNSIKALYTDEHSRWMFASRRLKIIPESIAIISEYQQSFQKWSVVWKIALAEEHLFLYESMNSAIIVPRRAFRDQQHFEEFIALARQYQQGGRRPAPIPTGILAGLPPPSDAFTRPNAS
jgi:hypothetical protein